MKNLIKNDVVIIACVGQDSLIAMEAVLRLSKDMENVNVTIKFNINQIAVIAQNEC